MAFRPESSRNGFCRVIFRSNMTLDLTRGDYPAIRHVLSFGRDPFYEGFDLYGDAQLIRLADVMHVKDCSPSGMASADRDDDDRRQHQLVEAL